MDDGGTGYCGARWAGHLVALSDAGDSVEIEASDNAVLLFGQDEPIKEPVGPFVMNTSEENHAALRDYQAGKFGT